MDMIAKFWASMCDGYFIKPHRSANKQLLAFADKKKLSPEHAILTLMDDSLLQDLIEGENLKCEKRNK